MFGIDPASLAQAKAAGRVLDKLLVGLVPVSGLAVDYKVINVQGNEWIIHEKLLSGISNLNPLSIRCTSSASRSNHCSGRM